MVHAVYGNEKSPAPSGTRKGVKSGVDGDWDGGGNDGGVVLMAGVYSSDIWVCVPKADMMRAKMHLVLAQWRLDTDGEEHACDWLAKITGRYVACDMEIKIYADIGGAQVHGRREAGAIVTSGAVATCCMTCIERF